ncbi:MAG: response regulator transcription factor [Rhodospirillales bacterium]|nr:response regulator transcription factor [Rhodospirillales bacterium]MDE0381118.1 response regulator transcription factor [Rhodospirillales bacterium]
MSSTIALVDDDQHLLTSVTMALEAEGFVVRPHSDPVKALQDLLSRPVDLAVLDIKMPQMDGLELLAQLRKHSTVPVVFLTSKDAEDDQLFGLSQGADDYITKPFSIRLLVERIRTILRRAEPARGVDSAHALMVRGALVLDEDRHVCTWQGEALSLTVTEFLLLKALAQRPGHVKSRNQLMDAAYGDQIYVEDRTIDSHVKRIRKKFRSIDPSFSQIETLYGVGYRYTAP